MTPSGCAPRLGRALFNELLPEDYPFVDYSVGKKQLSEIVNDLAERYPKVIVAATLDNLKAAGFHWATRSGVTVVHLRRRRPRGQEGHRQGYEAQDEKVQKQYERGLITKDERTQELIAIWTKATNEVAEAMNANFPKTNPIFMMVDSGARGNMMQMRQIAGMRGLVSNARTRRSRVPSRRRSVRVCPFWSTSSPPTVPVRVSPTPPCVPPTRVT